MPLTTFPVGKIVYVCDDVIADPTSHKPSILNIWEIIRIPAGSGFPYALGKVCVAAWMRDGLGDAVFRADIVRADTNQVVRRSQDYRVPFTDRTRSTLVVIRMRDVTFPAAGAYLVELFCDGQFVDDQVIHVLPG